MNRDDLYRLHDKLTEDALELMKKKNQDYASQEDAFGNLKGCQSLGIHPVTGILIRCMDKFARIQSFVDRGELSVKDESAVDSARDIINYMVLLAGLLEDEKKSPIMEFKVSDLLHKGRKHVHAGSNNFRAGEEKKQLADQLLEEYRNM